MIGSSIITDYVQWIADPTMLEISLSFGKNDFEKKIKKHLPRKVPQRIERIASKVIQSISSKNAEEID